MGKKLFWASAAAAAVVAASGYMLNVALSRKPTAQIDPPDTEEGRCINTWFAEGAKRVTHRTGDKQRLCAWFVPNANSRKYAVVCHGYGCSGKGMRHRAWHFYNMGFNILLPDARAHGGSSGEMIGMGWPERRDIVDWIYEILKRDNEAEIILYGESMGAATVMMTAGEVLPDNVKLVIEDCGYTDVWEEMSYSIKKKYKLPAFPIIPVASLLCKAKGGYRFRRASAVNQVKRCKIPMLFLHAENDRVVPYPMVFRLYAAAQCEKELVTFPDAGHCQCAEFDPELYWGSIKNFIEKYMNE